MKFRILKVFPITLYYIHYSCSGKKSCEIKDINHVYETQTSMKEKQKKNGKTNKQRKNSSTSVNDDHYHINTYRYTEI